MRSVSKNEFRTDVQSVGAKKLKLAKTFLAAIQALFAEYASVKAKSRRRNLPIPMALWGVFATMKKSKKFPGQTIRVRCEDGQAA